MLLRICILMSILSLGSLIKLKKVVWFDQNDAFMQVDDIIKKYGYISEIHNITTDDGYLLQTNRIVTKDHSKGKKPAVLLVHGFLGYAGNYVQNANRSLGFYLADHGYDVWIGNVRGTRYSKKHKTLDNTKYDYWNFSWHEMAVKDLPANIDYILKTTGNNNLSYVGHSQGTTIFFTLMSELPDYNGKVNVMHALAPIMSGKYTKNPVLLFLAKNKKELMIFANIFKYYIIDLEKYITKRFASLFCVSKISAENLCDFAIRTLTGLSRKESDQSVLIASHMTTASYKTFNHLAQCQNQFRKYDYGKSENLRRYGQAEPPAYKVERIKVPIVLHYGGNDLLNAVKDVEEGVVSYLTSIVDMNKIKKYGHLDFIAAEDIIELVYEKILNSLNKYN